MIQTSEIDSYPQKKKHTLMCLEDSVEDSGNWIPTSSDMKQSSLLSKKLRNIYVFIKVIPHHQCDEEKLYINILFESLFISALNPPTSVFNHSLK